MRYNHDDVDLDMAARYVRDRLKLLRAYKKKKIPLTREEIGEIAWLKRVERARQEI